VFGGEKILGGASLQRCDRSGFQDCGFSRCGTVRSRRKDEAGAEFCIATIKGVTSAAEAACPGIDLIAALKRRATQNHGTPKSRHPKPQPRNHNPENHNPENHNPQNQNPQNQNPQNQNPETTTLKTTTLRSCH
jgi:hypothetical protein